MATFARIRPASARAAGRVMLCGLGATVTLEPHDDAGYLTAILADPEGNEFCAIVPPSGSRDWTQLTIDPP